MIEFLSDSNWLSPQIDFLVYLQNIRLSHSDIFNKFFLSVTVFGEVWLPSLICAIVYWCFSTRNGMYLFSVYGTNVILAQLFKLIACVYRPWVLDSKVKPIESALNFAKSYSFPSGHSGTASSVLGGVAFILSRYKILVCLLVLLTFTVGFSRMWLGVHTPQDVIVGLTLGFILVFVFNPVINWAEKNKNNYLYLLGGIDIFAILSLIYVYFFNYYPTDYVDGKILVDFYHAIHTATIFYGYVLGLINGAFICRKFFPFEASEGSIKTRVIRGFVGVAILLFLLKLPVQIVLDGSYSNKISFISVFIFGFIITAVYPLIFTRVENLFKTSK